MFDKLMTAAEVADSLGVKPRTFAAHLPALRRDHGFPAPLPGLRRYDPLAIDRWRRERAGLSPAPAVPAAASNDDVAEWQDRLDRRSAGIGGGA